MKFTDQLRQLTPNNKFETDKTKAVCYVTAKRLGLSVTVQDHETHRTVRLTASAADDIADRLKMLSTSDRLAVFEHFELCCGMNRGECICEAETIEIAKPLPTITDNRKDVLNALQAKIDGIQTGSIAPEIVEEWKFTKATPQFADNGNVYRQQFRVSNGKPVYRNVEVDVDDLEQVK